VDAKVNVSKLTVASPGLTELAGTLPAKVSVSNVVVTPPGVTELAGTLPARVSASSVTMIAPGVIVIAGTLLARVRTSITKVVVATTEEAGTDEARVNVLKSTILFFVGGGGFGFFPFFPP